MGAAHPSRVTPILPESYAALTTEEVAFQVRALGEAYEGYAERVVNDGLDGAFLQNEVTIEDLPDMFRDLGVSSTVHQKKLAALFRGLKASSESAGTTGVVPQQSIVATMTSTTPKRFAGFLSHFKLEYGTEARLVQLQLKPIIEKSPI